MVDQEALLAQSAAHKTGNSLFIFYEEGFHLVIFQKYKSAVNAALDYRIVIKVWGFLSSSLVVMKE
jgi:hypothetical protein